MTYAIQADVEKFLQIDVTTEPSAPVTMLLENATGLISGHLQRQLELDSYIDTYDPPRGFVLRLRHNPVASSPAVAVTEDGTALVEGTDFLVYEAAGTIKRIHSDFRPRRWLQKLQTIVVTYDAGFDFTVVTLVAPDALAARDTCTRMVVRAFQAAAAWANAPDVADYVKSLTLAGSDSVTFLDSVSDVATAALQLTDADKHSLSSPRRRILVG